MCVCVCLLVSFLQSPSHKNKRQQQELIQELKKKQVKDSRHVYEGKDGAIEDIITGNAMTHTHTHTHRRCMKVFSSYTHSDNNRGDLNQLTLFKFHCQMFENFTGLRTRWVQTCADSSANPATHVWWSRPIISAVSLLYNAEVLGARIQTSLLV